MLFRIQDDGIFPVAAQMSYFLILSMFPFIMVFLNVLSFTSLVQEDVLMGIIKYLPIEVQEIIIAFVREVVATSSQGLLSIAAILGLWTAASGVRAVIRSINQAYGYKETRSYFRLQFMSVIFTIAILFLLTLIFATLVFGEQLGTRFFAFIGKTDTFLVIWTRLRIIIPIVYMILIFALLYRYSPDSQYTKDITFRSTLPGAIFSTFGWMITSLLFSYYVSNFGNFSITYGSLVGIVVLLIWLYLSSLIILIGGEINATLKFFKFNGFKIHEEKSFLYKLKDITDFIEERNLKES